MDARPTGVKLITSQSAVGFGASSFALDEINYVSFKEKNGVEHDLHKHTNLSKPKDKVHRAGTGPRKKITHTNNTALHVNVYNHLASSSFWFNRQHAFSFR